MRVFVSKASTNLDFKGFKIKTLSVTFGWQTAIEDQDGSVLLVGPVLKSTKEVLDWQKRNLKKQEQTS